MRQEDWYRGSRRGQRRAGREGKREGTSLGSGPRGFAPVFMPPIHTAPITSLEHCGAQRALMYQPANNQSMIQLLCRCQRNRSCLWGAQCPGGRGTRPKSIKEAKNALRGRRKRGWIKESSWSWTSEVVRHLIGRKV